jgi:hypothetical protein
VLVVLGSVPAAAQTRPTILSVHPDLTAATLTIVGTDFNDVNGVVRIGVPWTRQFEDVVVYLWSNNAIIAALPIGNQVPGTVEELPARFARRWREAGFPESANWTLAHGETRRLEGRRK